MKAATADAWMFASLRCTDREAAAGRIADRWAILAEKCSRRAVARKEKHGEKILIDRTKTGNA
jgi:hypothetical protein